MALRYFVNGKMLSHEAFLEQQNESSPVTPSKGSKGYPGEPELTPSKEILPMAKVITAEQSLRNLVASQRFLVLSLPNCPQCDELKAALTARGIESPNVFVKWDKGAPEYQDQKKVLAAHAGPVFTFPQVFANGGYEGGYKEVTEKLQMGAYDELFEQEFGLPPTTAKRWVEGRSMVVFSLPHCPQCDVLREHLLERALPVDTIFIKLDKVAPQYATLKAQLIELMGKSTFSFPQTFLCGEYQGDFDQVIAKSKDGHYDDRFAELFGAAPLAPRKAIVEEVIPAAAISFDDDF